MNVGNIWELLGGLGIFLWGMFQMEDSIKQIAGRSFKLFLRKHTGTKPKAILSGIFVTGALQSSSVVKLMVLAFVGAGIISMQNALGVVIGSNLGTTLDSWIVATLGFEFNIDSFAFPIIGIAGIGLIIFNNRHTLHYVSVFIMGFGFLFLGLNFMKESVTAMVQNFDFTPYTSYPSFVFVLIGFIITVLIQSSSATVAITLSALHTGALPFENAVAIIIGSELGTAVKISMGSLNGIPEKKRVALGNLVFNAFVTLFAYALMHPLIFLLREVMVIQNPLIALVAFQSMINVLGVVLFYPFLESFGNYLQKKFSDDKNHPVSVFKKVSPEDIDMALDILEKESTSFIHAVVHLNLEAFHVEIDNGKKPVKNIMHFEDYDEEYKRVKQREGDMLSFYFKMREEKIGEQDAQRLNRIIDSIRNAMYSAKGMKDLFMDRKDFRESADDLKFKQYKLFQNQLKEFYTELHLLLEKKNTGHAAKALAGLLDRIRDDYDTRMQDIYKEAGKKTLKEVDISTFLNVNRELYSSCKALLFSLRDHLLSPEEAEEFDEIPVMGMKGNNV